MIRIVLKQRIVYPAPVRKMILVPIIRVRTPNIRRVIHIVIRGIGVVVHLLRARPDIIVFQIITI